MINGDRAHEFLGAQSAPAFEKALAMCGAESQVSGEIIETRLLTPRLGEKADAAFDKIVIA